jgi:hypothetical protein
MKVKRSWFYASLGAGIVVCGLGLAAVGFYAIDSLTEHHSSSNSSPDVLPTPVDIRQLMTTTPPPTTSDDEKMNAFLARSGVTAPSDQAYFRDMAQSECKFSDEAPWAKLVDRAVLLHAGHGQNFKTDRDALEFLKESILIYCPNHKDLIPN